MSGLRERIRIEAEALEEINDFLLDGDNPLVNSLLEIVERYGGVEEIRRRAEEAGRLENLMDRLESEGSPHLRGLEWLTEKREEGAFISLPEYRRKILGEGAEEEGFDESCAVTLEISACNFFPWLIEEARRAIENRDLMPARYIRVRSMREQVEDGEILAFGAAMEIIGASHVQTLDHKGTMPGPDGQPINVHLGGAETITGYFGGVGVPNSCALDWVDEYLHYHTEYGVREVLNVNPGTVILGYMLHKLGVDIEFKISVFMGNDNPYSALWTLMTAKLFSREDGTTPLKGFNLSNSVDNETIELTAYERGCFGLEDVTRIEHHITEACTGIVRQPYDRLGELLEIAGRVRNISAKHEGGVPEVEETRERPSCILDYFMPEGEIAEKGLMPRLLTNYLDKHDAVNRTARALTERRLKFVAARNLHRS